MMTQQARPSAKINGFDTHMILEAVPARPSERPNGHQAINRTSRHYAGALTTAPVMSGQVTDDGGRW
jgi:hypothetical protein